MYTDFHTHNLDAPAGSIINPPIGEVDAFLARRPDATISVGIHPWDTAGEVDYAGLDRLARLPQVVAIGETGLDRLRGGAMERQEEVFRHHAALAEELEKPLVIHCVKAFDLLLRLKKELRPKQQWTVHGFRGNPTLARQLLDAGIDLSINPRHTVTLPADTPSHRIHHESD